MRRPGSDCSIVVMKRSNVRGAKGAGHPSRDRVNWKQEELTVLAEGGNFHWVARAVWPETVKHGSVRASGWNSPGLLGASGQLASLPRPLEFSFPTDTKVTFCYALT